MIVFFNKSRIILIFILVLINCGEDSDSTAQATEEATVHWAYEGETGPNQWGSLGEKYALCSELGILSKFVVSYIGAHGISQGVATIMEAAEILKYRDDIVFMLVGDGAMKKDMVIRKNDRDLKNVLMLPAQSKERIPDLYRASDVSIVPLRDIPLFDSFVPSKMFEIMSCGIPIIGSVNGEAREILELSGSARIIPPESVNELVDSIVWMMENPQKRKMMGISGRTFVCEHYDRTMLAKNYVGHLKTILK